MQELILSDWVGSVARLTLNHPQRHNSLVPALVRALHRAVGVVGESPRARALILQARGDHFSTGGDLDGFARHISDVQAYASELVGLLHQSMLALIDLPVPVVAAVQGHVTGGALGWVLTSDLVVITPETRFTPYYARVGFSPDGGWTAILPEVVGRRRAADILFRNRTLDAERALSIGLASEIAPTPGLWDRALEIASEIAAHSPGSVARTKRLLWHGREQLADRLEAERARFVAQIGTAEAQDRMSSFLAEMKTPESGGRDVSF